MPAHHHLSARGSELRTLRLRLLRLRHELGLIQREQRCLKYNPNQPRVPAGNAGGGQWTSGTGGGGGLAAGIPALPGFGPAEGAGEAAAAEGEAGWSSLGEGWSEDGSIFEQTVTDGAGTTIQSEYAASRAVKFDERQTVIMPSGTVSFETADNVQSIRYGGPDGEVVARSIWTPSGPEPDATVQPAFAPLVAAPAIITGGAILFNWLSPFDGSDGQQAVMGFDARDYRAGDSASGALDLTFVGRITQEEAELACRRLPDAQEFADRAANAAGSPDLYPSRAVYGTKVHSNFAQFVKDLHDINFRPERSFIKERIEGAGGGEVPYGYPGSVRVDAYEYRRDGTLCVYDLKTGRANLPDRRAEIIANAAAMGFNPILRVIVIAVRPKG